ncbi:hypothetical protein [Brucella pituitosa]|nr:hypothetical protein [Brucella pituitosa]KAB0572482.1 hypothetical protein F7Q93_06570 [Brucella pituitosa]PRA57655.1 hypothetical protein CQ062_02590 [Ochrobactrum sp. MYb68]
MNLRAIFCASIAASLLSIAPAQTQELTKQDYLALPAKSLKNFQCAILIQNIGNIVKPAASSYLLSSSFTQKAYDLGKQYYEALETNKISVMDLTLDMPSEFKLDTTTIMARDQQEVIAFKLGRISIKATADILYKVGAVNNEGEVDTAKFKKKSPELLDEYCDFEGLNMPAPMLEKLQHDLRSSVQE